jgi:hypothetical protein
VLAPCADGRQLSSSSPRGSAALPTATRSSTRLAQAGSRSHELAYALQSRPSQLHTCSHAEARATDRVQHRIDIPGQRGDQRRRRWIRGHLLTPEWVRSTAISVAQSPFRQRPRLNMNLSRSVNRLWPAPRSQPGRQLPGRAQRHEPSPPAATEPRARRKTRQGDHREHSPGTAVVD